jgi:CHAT domain-containing protein
VLPSLVALPSRGPARVDPRGAAVVVGDPPARAARGLGPLPGARAEALALAGAWEVPALVGRDATEAAVLERAWAARVLHLATHGVVDPADPLDGSFIHLADGGWTAREIQGARLDALELVVLSACQTARGRELEGGTVGLARAFWLAGADQVVASLWSVDDAATASLMLRLAAHLPEASPGEALRRAVVEQRRESPDPAHWAGFVVFGAPDAPPP